jgi:glycosyltransferase involved in cell wall biosynthesis
LASQRIICTNQHDRANVKSFHPSCDERLEVIPLASSMGSLATESMVAAEKYSLPDARKIWLLNFGTIMPNKGWETLLAALRILKDEDRKIGLLVAGELQPGKYAYHKIIQNKIRELKLEACIHFTGYFPAEQAPSILTACPIAVQPYNAGLSLRRSSFIALLAYGRAIVTTDPMYLLENVRHGHSFWGVIPNDPQALAEGIRHVLDHPEVMQRLMAGARQAAPYFSWQRVINLHQSLYQQVINL